MKQMIDIYKKPERKYPTIVESVDPVEGSAFVDYAAGSSSDQKRFRLTLSCGHRQMITGEEARFIRVGNRYLYCAECGR